LHWQPSVWLRQMTINLKTGGRHTWKIIII